MERKFLLDRLPGVGLIQSRVCLTDTFHPKGVSLSLPRNSLTAGGRPPYLGSCRCVPYGTRYICIHVDQILELTLTQFQSFIGVIPNARSCVGWAVDELKIKTFLDDPERSTKVFLSSHIIKTGVIWYSIKCSYPDNFPDLVFGFHRSDRNRMNTAHLVSLFINFLLRNKVLPEVRGLQDALAVARLATAELPLMAGISKTLPDAFHAGCRDCWGSKQEVYAMNFSREVAPTGPEWIGKRKRQEEVDNTSLNKLQRFNGFRPASWGNAQVNFSEESVTEDNDPGWTSNAEEILNPEWTAETGSVPVVETSIWQSQKHSLLPLLGPTALPITHCAGTVESSTRRITSIIPPSPSPPTSSRGSDFGPNPNPEAVELDLAERFAKVVLIPWIGNEIPQSRILATSQRVGGYTPSHDPSNDNIVLLVEPGTLEKFKVDMGIGATWVQLIRQAPRDADREIGADIEPRIGKTTYWYIDQLSNILPSYYTD
jgi:hypothetical protein